MVPVLGVDEARALSSERAGSVLCGERGGEPPEGFALGNSPLEYTEDVVAGRVLVLTTSNGTRALSMVSDAQKILMGSITNREAVCRACRGGDVTVVCAGTLGSVSLDDSIAAGLMIERLIGMGEYLLDSFLFWLFELTKASTVTTCQRIPIHTVKRWTRRRTFTCHSVTR